MLSTYVPDRKAQVFLLKYSFTFWISSLWTLSMMGYFNPRRGLGFSCGCGCVVNCNGWIFQKWWSVNVHLLQRELAGWLPAGLLCGDLHPLRLHQSGVAAGADCSWWSPFMVGAEPAAACQCSRTAQWGRKSSFSSEWVQITFKLKLI